jgi:D-amino peptidase
MARALIIVDLEGVAGVDSIGALLAGAPEYTRSRGLVTEEVNAVVEGLLEAGFTHVRVSDSHLSGSGEMNLLMDALHPAAEPHFHEEDACAERFFEDVAAVVCVGMHAAAGSEGFGAHTMDLLGAWTCAGRALSEADVVLGLAAEAGVPAVFVSGDDVLGTSLGERVAFVRTKAALSATRAYSRPREQVLAELRRAARSAPRVLEPLAHAPLELSFKSLQQARLAAATGARPVGPYQVRVEGASFRERYTRALAATRAATGVMGQGVTSSPGSPALTRDVVALVRLSGAPSAPPPAYVSQAERALTAFLSLTSGEGDEARALRALTLHMLEGHAPRLFARLALGPVLQEAVEALAEVSLALPAGLDPDVGMARVDAWFVRRQRGLSHQPLAPAALSAYLGHLGGEGYGHYAWLLGEMAATCGLDVRLSMPERAYREVSRVVDLYWLTHLYLLDSHYLRRPVGAPDAAAWTEELLVATPWLLEQGHADLAGEVAFCLQCVGESGGGAHAALLSFLAARLSSTGSMGTDAHATATALLAFAGAVERG